MTAVHVVLAVALDRLPMLGAVHAALILLAGLFAVLARRPLEGAMAVAYLATGEVLWRALKIPTPWEYSKYALLLLCTIHLVRLPARERRLLLPLTLAFLLLPSCIAVAAKAEFSDGKVRELLMFGLVAPMALVAAVAMGRTLALSPREFGAVAFSAVLPAVTIAVLTALRTYGRDDLVFTGESNFETSGGFGPNQVSTVLSFGATMALLMALEAGLTVRQRLLYLSLTLGLLLQSIMTFSRGGLYNLAGAFVLALPWLLRRKGTRLWVVGLLGAGTLGLAVLFARADAFTGGSLAKRFQDTNTTGRYELIFSDIGIFLANPLLGVGPGGAKYARTDMAPMLTHTEVTRVLSEHGLAGVCFLLLLSAMLVQRYRHTRSLRDRSHVVLLLCWVTLCQANAALRTCAPMIGLLLLFACERRERDEYRMTESAPA